MSIVNELKILIRAVRREESAIANGAESPDLTDEVRTAIARVISEADAEPIDIDDVYRSSQF